MKFKVKAVALSRKTGFQLGNIKMHTINTSTNKLFTQAKTNQDVKKIFEGFWNINPHSLEKVKVLDITRVM